MSLKTGLPPVARADARVLILGSLPGDASLAAARYYAHPRNHFWTLIGEVIGTKLADLDYAERIVALQNGGVALWDVIGEAYRPGSLDVKIRDAKVNDLRAFAGRFPRLRAIAFNGKKAAALAGGALDAAPFDIIHLPSSSPANTTPLASKKAAWSALSPYLQNLEHCTAISR